MAIQEILKRVTERIQSAATVKTVYGEPVYAEGKTIIPVARVRYAFGAGGASDGDEANPDENETPQEEIAGGGGGAVEVTPVGFIEVTAGDARYVSFDERRRIIRAVVVGLLVAIFLVVRKRRKN